VGVGAQISGNTVSGSFVQGHYRYGVVIIDSFNLYGQLNYIFHFQNITNLLYLLESTILSQQNGVWIVKWGGILPGIKWREKFLGAADIH